MTDKHIPASKLLALQRYEHNSDDFDGFMFPCVSGDYIKECDLRALIDEAPEVEPPPSPDLTKLVGELVEALPMQPVVIAKDGAVRFKENRIVSAVLEHASKAGYSLNEIACGDFTDEEHMQFAQLIGYSVSGYGNLSYASEQSVSKADEIAEALLTRAKEYLK